MTLQRIETQHKSMDKLRDYAQFLKLRLASLVVFSSTLGYLIAAGPNWEWSTLIGLTLGGFLIVGASNGINQILERESDCLMHRTRNRPMPDGRMKKGEAVVVAFLTAISGIFMIYISTHILTTILSIMAMLSYGFVYTPMKRVSPVAVFIGAFPGALPVLIGYSAFSGHLNFEAGILFLVQFIWQFPHFWSIAWVLHKDYSRAGFRLLPGGGDPSIFVARYILFITLFLVPVGLAPAFLGYTPFGFGALSILMAGAFLYPCWKLVQQQQLSQARKLMLASFVYLPVMQLGHWLFKLQW
ncbi:MAG: protoheme IX farnesyltransferase [Sphingomonadales bacterium]|nr:protoheme IX farnesyltransferase [Sphingomonadales bacterium]